MFKRYPVKLMDKPRCGQHRDVSKISPSNAGVLVMGCRISGNLTGIDSHAVVRCFIYECPIGVYAIYTYSSNDLKSTMHGAHAVQPLTGPAPGPRPS